MSRDAYVFLMCMLMLAGYLMFGAPAGSMAAEIVNCGSEPTSTCGAPAGRRGELPKGLRSFDGYHPNDTARWNVDLVLGQGGTEPCAPGSLKFDKNELWICKAFPRYVKIETNDGAR